MDNVKLTIDGVEVEAAPGTTILDAAKSLGIDIPTLCYHPSLCREGACRVCVVEVEGARNLAASCVYPVANGMVVKTNTPQVREARKTVVELMLAGHPKDCLSCARNQKCELQQLAYKMNIRESKFKREKSKHAIDSSSPSIVRDPNKCILCGRCVRVCNQVQSVGALGLSGRGINSLVTPAFEHGLTESPCVACGQCSAVCPVGAIFEKDDTDIVWEALSDKDKYVVVQVAPAVRAALGEEFGMPAGSRVTGKLAAALKRLGFKNVFDTQFAADLTIMEEGHELLERLNNGGTLPLITSCSPGWINFCETFHSDFIDNLSSCKSPQQMFGAVLKTYYAEKMGIDPAKIFSVSVMPCTAKKFECKRPEMGASGYRDVDVVITTRELARMIRTAGLDFVNLQDGEFDSPLGVSTGAATIFGVAGGVMEAALRTVYEVVTKKRLENVELTAVRGLEGIREAEIDLDGTLVKVAVVNGLANANTLLNEIREGKRNYHFVEIMACPGGCICGGGQPLSSDPNIRMKRACAIYEEDRSMLDRKSHKNPAVIRLYDEFLGSPGSEKAHHLLHTSYGENAGKSSTEHEIKEAI